MTHLSDIVPVEADGGAVWNDCIRIYEEAFPEWEREPERVLVMRVKQGRYKIYAGMIQGRAVGFYILDIEDEGQIYALFSYIAVDVRERGKGYGTELTRHAFEIFSGLPGRRWMLIEAEKRQAELYGRLGFLKIDVDYLVPRYDGSGSEAMSLMAVPSDRSALSIESAELRQIVERIYRSGYKLNADDPRLEEQLALIPAGEIRLMAWPPKTA
ncbi:MAG: GNAT family N-acetyltransferase [Rhodomicrobiaceae bacterium]